MRYLLTICLIFILSGCATKQPVVSKSATVIFKTPSMKFYDKGFISKYEDHIHLQIFNIGKVVLDLKIYKDRICSSTFKCLNSKQFNSTYLHSSYDNNFLYELFSKNKIYHKDKQNKIIIKAF